MAHVRRRRRPEADVDPYDNTVALRWKRVRRTVSTYFEGLPVRALRRVVRYSVGAGDERASPFVRRPYKEGLCAMNARTALGLVRCLSRLGEVAREEFGVLKETMEAPVDGEGLQLCTRKPADYQALERFLKHAKVHTLVLEVEELPKRYTKLVRRAMPNIRKLSMHFPFRNRGYELERIFAVTVPLETFEGDFEHTDRSYLLSLERYANVIKQLRLTFAGTGSIRNSLTLGPVWIAAQDSLREVELITVWGSKFEAVDTLLRSCKYCRVTVNGQLIRP